MWLGRAIVASSRCLAEHERVAQPVPQRGEGPLVLGRRLGRGLLHGLVFPAIIRYVSGMSFRLHALSGADPGTMPAESDPVMAAILNAPLDDREDSEEERAAVEEGLADIRAGRWVSADAVAAMLGEKQPDNGK